MAAPNVDRLRQPLIYQEKMRSVNILIKPASSLCNMRCKYCFYSDVAESRSTQSYGIMTEETIEALIKKVFDVAEESAGFLFQGGEPTLAGLPFFKRVIELQKKYNVNKIPVQNSIQTNGYAINDEWAQFLTESKFLVGLSIDGTRETHNSLRIDASGKGTYDKVMNAARLFDKHGVEFNILCVVNNFVARYPRKVYNELKRFKYLQFIPCLDPFDGEKQPFSLTNERYASFLCATFDEYYRDFMEGNYVSIRNFDNYVRIFMGYPPENCAMCGRCTCYFVAEGDGSIFPCDFYVLDEWKLGNVHESSFEELLESEKAKKFVAVSGHISEKCRACRYYPLCRGGCRRDREPLSSGMPSLNRLCAAYEKFFEYTNERMAEMAKKLLAKNYH